MKLFVQFRQRYTFRGKEFLSLCTNLCNVFGSEFSVSTFFLRAIDRENGKWYHYIVIRERYTFHGQHVFSYTGLKTKGQTIMTENIYALIRVSTEEQNEARQIKRMLELGIPKENIVVEKESGKSTVRAKYRKLVKQLKNGDTLYIENVDRLSRDYDGILHEWYILTVKQGVTIKVLDTPMLDTDQTTDSLLFKFIRNIMLHILAFQAENEWQKIKSRQAEGIAIAKANGKSLGRPKTVRTEEELEIARQYLNDEIGIEIALTLLGIKKTAFYNLCQAVSETQN